MKQGDLVWVLCRVNRAAKDGSWIDVQVPTMDPGTGRNYTVSGKRLTKDGWWSRAVRTDPANAYLDDDLFSDRNMKKEKYDSR